MAEIAKSRISAESNPEQARDRGDRRDSVEPPAPEATSLGGAYPPRDELPFSLFLELTVKDRETIEALWEYSEGADRETYALEALKIGVMALRHASGRLDGELIQKECSRMLDAMQRELQQHSRQVEERLGGEMKNYFDPENGRFSERVHRLVKQDGELERLLGQQIGGKDSQLSRTLMSHFGTESPLMKLLSPHESQGLLATLNRALDDQLRLQRDRLLDQFSLDNKQGALSRLRNELSDNHGKVSQDLREKIDEVVKQFSLDQPDSSISRLNAMLKDTQGAIHTNLTLDREDSPLARLKRELLKILDSHSKTNQSFQEEVKVALGKLVATRAEADRSTRHGTIFEDAVCEVVLRESQRAGDVAEATGNETGRIKNCKVGDCVVRLGPDSPAPGAKIVVEAKEKANYSLAKAQEEIEQARKNRGAALGLFVFSKRSAPSGLEPFARLGKDVVVVWDAEDPTSDIYLKAGLCTARALCMRDHGPSRARVGDFEAIEAAILEIEKRSSGMEEITKSAETIQSASGKILDRVRLTRKALECQVSQLQEKIGDLKAAVQSEADV